MLSQDHPDSLPHLAQDCVLFSTRWLVVSKHDWIKLRHSIDPGHSLLCEALLAKIKKQTRVEPPKLQITNDLKQMLGRKTAPQHLEFGD